LKHAEKLGRFIAENNWVLLTGGRNTGVMDAASKGAFEAGGSVIGVLPGDSHDGMSDFVTIPILTGMGSARNVINILTADVVVVCGMGPGTASEAALALKHDKPVMFTKVSERELELFLSFQKQSLPFTDDFAELIDWIGTSVRSLG
jgi:uncharacterized protein (TIGR00725 family)